METLNEYSGHIMLAIIFLGCMFIMVNSVYRIHNNKNNKTYSESQFKELGLYDVGSGYFLNYLEYKKMRELGSNTVKLVGGSGIGICVKCLDERGDWIDITDYSCW